MGAVRKKRKVIFLRDHKERKTKRVDTDPQTTAHHGFVGLFELALRRFKTTVYLLTIMPLYLLGSLIMGVSLVPGIFVYQRLQEIPILQEPVFLRFLVKGLSVGLGFFLFGFCLTIIVPSLNFVMRTSPKPFRGPYYSVDFLRWFIHNALTYLVRYSFLDFITPTPFSLLFYRLMGMKIGRGTQINTSNISDPALIELGEYVTIGGSVTLCAHYGMGGYLILAPVKVGNKVTIGLKASVMGGVEIGDGAKILPHSVVLPKTKIPPDETWGGVPAVKIQIKRAA